MEAVVPCVMDQVEKGRWAGWTVIQVSPAPTHTNEHGKILGNSDQTQLCHVHCHNANGEKPWGDVEILGNVICDGTLDVIHLVLRGGVPSPIEYKTLLRLRRSGNGTLSVRCFTVSRTPSASCPYTASQHARCEGPFPPGPLTNDFLISVRVHAKRQPDKVAILRICAYCRPNVLRHSAGLPPWHEGK